MNLTVMPDGSERIHYRDPSIPIYVSRGDLKTFPDMAALCHWHEDVEFLLPFIRISFLQRKWAEGSYSSGQRDFR